MSLMSLASVIINTPQKYKTKLPSSAESYFSKLFYKKVFGHKKLWKIDTVYNRINFWRLYKYFF